MYVVTTLNSQHSNDLSDLLDSLESLTKGYQKVVIQWVHSIARSLETRRLTSSQNTVQAYNKTI
jgi:hypothetical protein